MHSLLLLKALTELRFDVDLAKRLSKETQFTRQFATNNIAKYNQSFNRLKSRKIIIEKKTTSARLGAWRKTYFAIDQATLIVWLKQVENLQQ